MLQEVGGQVRWAGGDTVVVQLGDVLDRGDSEIGQMYSVTIDAVLPCFSLMQSDCMRRSLSAAITVNCMQVLSCF